MGASFISLAVKDFCAIFALSTLVEGLKKKRKKGFRTMNASVELVKHARMRITHIQVNSHKHRNTHNTGIVFSSS